jgi:hypothetical protein
MKCNHPFGTFPEWMLDAEVSDRAFRLFGQLDRHRRGAKSIEVKQQEISDWLGCSLKSVERALHELRAIGAIDVVPNVDGLRGQRESTYFLWPWGGDTGDGASYVSSDGAGTPSVTDPGTTPVTSLARASRSRSPLQAVRFPTVRLLARSLDVRKARSTCERQFRT